MSQKESEWEKEFDEKILYRFGKEHGRWNCMPLEEERVLKAFIKELLSNREKEIAEEVKKFTSLSH